MTEECCLARNGAQRKMLVGAADDSVKIRVMAVCNPVDLGDVAFCALAIVLRKFSERPLGRAPPRQDAALQNNLRGGGHAHRIG